MSEFYCSSACTLRSIQRSRSFRVGIVHHCYASFTKLNDEDLSANLISSTTQGFQSIILFLVAPPCVLEVTQVTKLAHVRPLL